MYIRNLLAAGMLAVALIPAAAFAANQDFTLRNRTGYTINEVYVSSVRSDDWEEDVMGRDTLEDGDAVDISFSRGERACRWDLKVIYEDGDEAEWSNLNLCATSEISLRYDHKSGRTWANAE